MFEKWINLFLSLGSSLLEVFKAELDDLGREIGASGKNLGKAVGFFGAAVAFAFWTLGIFTYALVQVLAIWLPLWGAGLALTGVFLLIMAILALIGMNFWKKVQDPRENLRRHLDDHLDWWQNRLSAPREPVGGVSEGSEKGEGMR